MPQLLGLSAFVFILIQMIPDTMNIASFCGKLSLIDMGNLELMRTIVWSPELIALDWVLMVLAMMPVLLSGPISHIIRSVRSSHIIPALVFFALGYVLTWLLAGAVFLPLLIILSILTANGVDILCALTIAIVWSGSPLAQFARNRCHKFTRIGWRFYIVLKDSLRQGLITGTACVGSCWAWMILPMTIERGHIVVMGIVVIILFAERLTPPTSPKWRLFVAYDTLFGNRSAHSRSDEQDNDMQAIA